MLAIYPRTNGRGNIQLKYHIWMEGYFATGMDSPSKASYLGEVEADSWQEACDIKGGAMEIGSYHIKFYNAKNRSYWGCGFFDNEIDARKTFG